jgi:hypothetical protein
VDSPPQLLIHDITYEEEEIIEELLQAAPMKFDQEGGTAVLVTLLLQWLPHTND